MQMSTNRSKKVLYFSIFKIFNNSIYTTMTLIMFFSDPSNPCPNECPIQCPPGFMPCPGAPHGNNCEMPDNCIPETSKNFIT